MHPLVAYPFFLPFELHPIRHEARHSGIFMRANNRAKGGRAHGRRRRKLEEEQLRCNCERMACLSPYHPGGTATAYAPANGGTDNPTRAPCSGYCLDMSKVMSKVFTFQDVPSVKVMFTGAL
jgi:hypothetical protein